MTDPTHTPPDHAPDDEDEIENFAPEPYDDSTDADTLFKPERDGDGNRIAQPTEYDGHTISVIPLNYGDIVSQFGEASVADIDETVLASVFQKHVVAPDMSTWTKNDVLEMKPLAPARLMEAIFAVSDVDVNLDMEGTRGQVEFTGNPAA